MKKLHVNEDACIGCGACVAIDGAHFDFNDDGLSEVISNENVDTEDARNAMSSCPTNAISYIEENEETPVETEVTENTEKNCECENCTCENCECTEGECHCGDTCNCESDEDENCTCKECHCHDENN